MDVATVRILALILGVLLFFLIVSIFGRASRFMILSLSPTLVLRKAHIDDRPSASTLVEVTGRASGFISWLLTLLKIEPVTTLLVSPSDCSFKSTSLMGIKHVFVPLYDISSTACGYHRPLYYLFFAGVIGASSLLVPDIRAQSGFFWVGMLLALGLVLAYFLTKKILISVETNGGHVLGLQFKPSVIENVSVDLAQALKLIRVVNNAVLSAKGLQPSSDSARSEKSFSPSAAANGICPACSSAVDVGSRFCDSCGASLP